MTREEAKTYLDVIWNRYRAEYEIEKETMEAYHMAIEALNRQKGEWIKKGRAGDDGYWIWVECSKCGAKPLLNIWHRQEELSNFCPNCGADMRGEE